MERNKRKKNLYIYYKYPMISALVMDARDMLRLLIILLKISYFFQSCRRMFLSYFNPLEIVFVV